MHSMINKRKVKGYISLALYLQEVGYKSIERKQGDARMRKVQCNSFSDLGA